MSLIKKSSINIDEHNEKMKEENDNLTIDSFFNEINYIDKNIMLNTRFFKLADLYDEIVNVFLKIVIRENWQIEMFDNSGDIDDIALQQKVIFYRKKNSITLQKLRYRDVLLIVGKEINSLNINDITRSEMRIKNFISVLHGRIVTIAWTFNGKNGNYLKLFKDEFETAWAEYTKENGEQQHRINQYDAFIEDLQLQIKLTGIKVDDSLFDDENFSKLIDYLNDEDNKLKKTKDIINKLKRLRILKNYNRNDLFNDIIKGFDFPKQLNNKLFIPIYVDEKLQMKPAFMFPHFVKTIKGIELVDSKTKYDVYKYINATYIDEQSVLKGFDKDYQLKIKNWMMTNDKQYFDDNPFVEYIIDLFTPAKLMLASLAYIFSPFDDAHMNLAYISGKSGTGKSTIAELIDNIFNDKIIVDSDGELTVDTNSKDAFFENVGRLGGLDELSDQNSIVELLYKSIAIINENPKNALNNKLMSVIKTLTAHESLTTKMLYKDKFKYKWWPFIFVFSNSKLRIVAEEINFVQERVATIKVRDDAINHRQSTNWLTFEQLLKTKFNKNFINEMFSFLIGLSLLMQEDNEFRFFVSKMKKENVMNNHYQNNEKNKFIIDSINEIIINAKLLNKDNVKLVNSKYDKQELVMMIEFSDDDYDIWVRKEVLKNWISDDVFVRNNINDFIAKDEFNTTISKRHHGFNQAVYHNINQINTTVQSTFNPQIRLTKLNKSWFIKNEDLLNIVKNNIPQKIESPKLSDDELYDDIIKHTELKGGE